MNSEHVYARKWRHIYPNDVLPMVQWGRQRRDNVVVERLQRGPYPKRPFEQEVRAACEPCNNGWMRRLEEEAEPELRRLLDCVPHDLSPADSDAVARWVAKTAIVVEQLFPHPPTLSKEQGKAFTGGALPEGFLCYMYALEPGDRLEHHSFTGSFLPDRDGSNPAEDGTYGIVTVHFQRVAFVCVHAAHLGVLGFMRSFGVNEVLADSFLIRVLEPEPWPASRPIVPAADAYRTCEMAQFTIAAGLGRTPFTLVDSKGRRAPIRLGEWPTTGEDV